MTAKGITAILVPPEGEKPPLIKQGLGFPASAQAVHLEINVRSPLRETERERESLPEKEKKTWE